MAVLEWESAETSFCVCFIRVGRMRERNCVKEDAAETERK